MGQDAKPAPKVNLACHTSSDPLSFAAAVQRELRAIDPTVAIDHVRTFDRIRADSVAAQTFAMQLLAGFSIVGCALALVGIYGALSLSVDSRKRDLAIRLAVGAQRRTVLGLVLSGGLKLILMGLVIGSGVAFVLARVLRTFLFEVQPNDPMTFAVVAVLFSAVALLACLSPALRATQVDPMTTLRCE